MQFIKWDRLIITVNVYPDCCLYDILLFFLHSDRINADEILEEAATEISQNKKLVDEHGVTPFVRATLQGKIHQGNLQKV